MSEFNKVTIGRSPHDEESLIKGLLKDFKNNNGHIELKGMGGTVTIEPTEKLNYLGDIQSNTNETSS